MVSHPNRSKKSPKPGRNPTPQEIVSARKAAGLTQAEAARLVHGSESGWKKWELGIRRMRPDAWELFQIKLKDLSTPDAAASKTSESSRRGG